MIRMNTLGCVSVTALLALGACSSRSSSPHGQRVTGDEARQLLINRNWLDKMPETEREQLHVYRFVPSMGGGVFQDRTLFKGVFELFSFESTADQIRFVLHETHDTVTSPYTIERVDGPAPFDLKLTLPADPRGPHVYFGIRAETSSDSSVLDADLAVRSHH